MKHQPKSRLLAGIALVGILVGTAVWIGTRFFNQYCHAEVVVVTVKPLPDFLKFKASKPPVGPQLMQDSVAYDKALDKPISPDDLRAIRRVLAWKASRLYRPDLVEIHSPTNVSVVARRDRSHSVCITFIKPSNEWQIDSETFGVYERMNPGFLDQAADFFQRTFRRFL